MLIQVKTTDFVTIIAALCWLFVVEQLAGSTRCWIAFMKFCQETLVQKHAVICRPQIQLGSTGRTRLQPPRQFHAKKMFVSRKSPAIVSPPTAGKSSWQLLSGHLSGVILVVD